MEGCHLLEFGSFNTTVRFTATHVSPTVIWFYSPKDTWCSCAWIWCFRRTRRQWLTWDGLRHNHLEWSSSISYLGYPRLQLHSLSTQAWAPYRARRTPQSHALVSRGRWTRSVWASTISLATTTIFQWTMHIPPFKGCSPSKYQRSTIANHYNPSKPADIFAYHKHELFM